MNNYLVKVKVRNGEYENSALSLVKASSENEACKVALLNQCHNDIGDGAEWIDSGISVTLFPDVNVTHLFWDEGAGFAGFKKFENGVMIDEHVDEICFIEAEFAEGEFQESPVYPYFMEEILNK